MNVREDGHAPEVLGPQIPDILADWTAVGTHHVGIADRLCGQNR